jgi:hypothetical protein
MRDEAVWVWTADLASIVSEVGSLMMILTGGGPVSVVVGEVIGLMISLFQRPYRSASTYRQLAPTEPIIKPPPMSMST